MKMISMKKSWKNRSAVSPVIATILMVAITVVLAAVLYVMVMGFGGDSGQAPTASISKTVDNRLQISIDKTVDYDKLKFSVNNTDVKVFAKGATSTAGEGLGSVTFIDPADNGKVEKGDYFTFTGHGLLTILYVNGDSTESIATYNF